MDVNESNFWDVLPRILESISIAEYVSVDLEMTGVLFSSNTRARKPTLEEVYSRAKAGAEGFQILQFGMTCFYYDEDINGMWQPMAWCSCPSPS